MNWCDEHFVKVYTRDTIDWSRLGWEAQGIFLLLLRKVDRAGVLDLGSSGLEGLADVLRIPFDVFSAAVDKLVADGCVTLCHAPSRIVLPNFLEAQTAVQTDKQRQHESRARRRDAAKLSESQDTGHVVSRYVTRCHSRLDETRRDDTRLETPPYPPRVVNGVTAEPEPEAPPPTAEPEPEAPPPTEPPPWLAAGSRRPSRPDRESPPYQRTGQVVPAAPSPTLRCKRCGKTGSLVGSHTELLCLRCAYPPIPEGA